MRKCLFLILFFSVSNALFSQDKFEKESRIKSKDVPSKALIFIDSITIKTKIKWYREEGFNTKSIEGKFKLNKVKYSIEFDIAGNIEDIELEMKWKDLDSILRDSISAHLNLDCSRYKVEKVQKQFTGSEQELLSVFKLKNTFYYQKTKYELIVKCTQQKNVDLYEYLFDNYGKLISKSKIVFKNSSHLEY